MKKKDDKIILNAAYESDRKEEIPKYLESTDSDRFEFVDDCTVMFKPTEGEAFELHLNPSGKKDKSCLEFLSKIDDISKLQPEYKLTAKKIQISFFITRLSEEELDNYLFEAGISPTDIDAKAMVGIFLDNRFHG